MGASVLVVDDIQANLKLVEAMLEPLDCEVVLASSGREALRHLAEKDFAVLVLDVQMPEMDGYALARAARQEPRSREVPIIFLTAAKLDDAAVLHGYGSGAVDLLFKPLRPDVLTSKIQVFLELHASQRRVLESKRELERAYRELQATQVQLVQSAKMASLGQLVAGIAHEVNNPLAFALSHLHTARRCLEKAETLCGSDLPSAAKSEWDRALSRLVETSDGLERIRTLVAKLRVFSRLDEGHFKPVSIRESVESVLTVLGHRIGDRIVLQTEFRAPDTLECYPSLLNQAVLNLVANAIDALGGSGTISLRAGERDGAFEISVSDTGPGIPVEILDRVLEPFFTTKAVDAGIGLGLAICDSIARRHGGTLKLECPETGGTRATLRFPISGSP